MKKLVVLITAFAFAACSDIDFNIGETANAQGGSAGTGGAPSVEPCACERDVGAFDGSRLKAKWLVGDDGSRMQTNTWFDTELNDTCHFQLLPTGETRCVPPAPTLNSYIDAGCTVPAIVLKDDCDVAPKYARIDRFDYTPLACSGPKMTGFSYVSFNTASQVNGVANIYALSATGECQPNGGVPLGGGGWRIYTTYPIHDGAWFVKAEQGTGF
jgi:hypothetical protein